MKRKKRVKNIEKKVNKLSNKEIQKKYWTKIIEMASPPGLEPGSQT